MTGITVTVIMTITMRRIATEGLKTKFRRRKTVPNCVFIDTHMRGLGKGRSGKF